MNVTEAEARKKWCPFGRESVFNDGGGHPDFQHTLAGNRGECKTLCIASDCMAWRAAGEAKRSTTPTSGYHMEPVGYCGLAGAP